MEEIKGYIERIVFTHSESGFTIARLQEKDKDDLTTLTGYLASIKDGETVSCQGEWKRHPKYGMQFVVNSFSVDYPASLIGIKKYLESGLIKGIGPMYADKIVEKFKEETLHILDTQPEKLLEIPGIGEKKIAQIHKCWQEQRSIRQVMIFLQSHGVSPGFAQKIYKKYGQNSIEIVKNNPFSLAKDLTGIGFKSADKIAVSLGCEKTNSKRVCAGIEFLLWELTNEGHTCYPKDLLIDRAKVMLEIDEESIASALTVMRDRKEVIEEVINGTIFIWHTLFHHYEQEITKEIQRLKNHSPIIRPIDEQKALTWVEDKLYLHFAQEQKKALFTTLEKKMHIITGGPGTGKSTITKAILTILEKVTSKITLCAPTGRAAKRMSQITRKKAFTIHSILEFDFQNGGFKKNAQNQLEADFIIIDEASMIDTFLLYSLLKAIPDSTKVLIIGDIDQLPSVGAGHILKDLIMSNVIPVTRLQEIFRQAKGSQIIINAHKINRGEFPFLQTYKNSDFHFFEENEPEKIVEKIVSLVKNELPKKYFFDPVQDIQVLSPMRKGPIGIHTLNNLLQQSLNPSAKPFLHDGKTFHIYDKVMQIKNNYNKKVYNGDIGRIIEIDFEEGEIIVSFENFEVEYTLDELDELVLAYAVSVHKYQGSECPCIVMPIHTSHFMLLYRNLLYTAVTRGKKFVALVGSKKAVAITVRNEKTLLRHTGLCYFLQKQLL